jgi:hypothetical protein
VPWLKCLVSGRRRPGFNPRSVHVGFVVDKVALGQDFSPSASVFPCQYHAINAPYSFIHLPPTVYNVFLPVLQSPLSVSFHQCSVFIFILILLIRRTRFRSLVPLNKKLLFRIFDEIWTEFIFTLFFYILQNVFYLGTTSVSLAFTYLRQKMCNRRNTLGDHFWFVSLSVQCNATWDVGLCDFSSAVYWHVTDMLRSVSNLS